MLLLSLGDIGISLPLLFPTGTEHSIIIQNIHSTNICQVCTVSQGLEKCDQSNIQNHKSDNFYNLINAVKQEGIGAEGKGILPPGEDFTEEWHLSWV